MANISSAYGLMTLRGDWTWDLITQFKKIASEVWAQGFYNIQLGDCDPAEYYDDVIPVISFCGSGRWAFESTLEHLGDWTDEEVRDKPELKTAYEELLSGMYENDLKIELSSWACQAKAFEEEYNYVLIADCRFPNEIHRWREEGYPIISVHVERLGFDNGLTEEQKNHASETALDDYMFDVYLKATNLTELREEAKKVCKILNLRSDSFEDNTTYC